MRMISFSLKCVLVPSRIVSVQKMGRKRKLEFMWLIKKETAIFFRFHSWKAECKEPDEIEVHMNV